MAVQATDASDNAQFGNLGVRPISKMALPKAQNPLDWLAQCWHICMGRRVDPQCDEWLLGPIGRPDEKSGEFIERFAAEKRLTVCRNAPGAGLHSGISDLGLSITSEVADFYLHTIDYTFEATSSWEAKFGILGRLVSRLFGMRVQQLNLPTAKPHMTSRFSSEIIQLVDDEGKVVYTIWIRSIEETGEVVFYGVYLPCRLPSGACGVKSVFPLPQGNVTVIFALRQGSLGELQLVAAANEVRDTGFYVFVEDRRGVLWKRYIPALRQQISVCGSGDSELAAEHSISMYRFKAYQMNYKIRKKGCDTSI